MLSNTRKITSFTGVYGLEFSPGSQYLYIGEEGGKKLHQCAIPGSTTTRYNVCFLIDSSATTSFGSLQLGPDGKIYSDVYSGTYLGAINKPDNFYTSCGYVKNAVSLDGKRSNWGLPTFYQTFFVKKDSLKASDICLGDTAHIALFVDSTGIDSLTWFIGDTINAFLSGSKLSAIKYLFADSGYQSLKVVIYYKKTGAGIIRKKMHVGMYPKLELGNDTAVCSGGSVSLHATYPGAKYMWQDAKTDSVYIAKAEGRYTVTSTFKGCTATDSMQVTINSYPWFNLGGDTLLCETPSFTLNATCMAASYLWQDSTTNAFFNVTQSGMYWVQVNHKGCLKSDSIDITMRAAPHFSLGKDTILCDTATMVLTVPANYQAYLWNDASVTSYLKVSKPGLYSVLVSDSGCSASDAIDIHYLDKPLVKLGNDTSVCAGISIYLQATNPAANYRWSNLSTDSVQNITQEGTYWARADNFCGTSSDTTNISFTVCNCIISVPNSFTPNGDLLNDIFIPVANCAVVNYHLLIFNRWGVLVFETRDPLQGWDGKAGGNFQWNDVFFWKLEADLVHPAGAYKNQQLKGNVTLMD